MNTQLGNGKVHARYADDSKLPMCGGNRAAESYRLTDKDVTCLKCLAEIEKQAEMQPVETQAQINEGDMVEVTSETEIDQPTGCTITVRAGTRGVVVEVYEGRTAVEYLVKFDGRERAEWLYASEIRKASVTTARATVTVCEWHGLPCQADAEYRWGGRNICPDHFGHMPDSSAAVSARAVLGKWLARR